MEIFIVDSDVVMLNSLICWQWIVSKMLAN